MTHLLIKGTVIGALASGLAACANAPSYPIASRSPPPPAAASPAQQAAQSPPSASPQSAPANVTSQPLAPVQPSAETAPPAAAAPPPAPIESASPERPSAESPRPPPEPPRYTATGKVVDAHKMFRDYQVRKGDHLDAIARDLQTTRAVLIEANHLKKPDALTPGQHLRVPIEKAYVAQSGDTLAAVAKRFDVSAEDLADLNALSEQHRLHSGEELALPSVIHDHGPVQLPATRFAGRYSPSGGYTPSPWALRAGASRGQTPSNIRPPGVYSSPAAPTGPALTDAQVAEAGRGRFIWPVKGDILSPFGVQDVGRRNDGVDVKAPQGAAVHAAAAGDVVYAGDQVPGFGNLVLVKHADGWVTAYAHLDKVTVKMRDTVEQGQEIGLVGQSGGVSEPQLHFEIRYAPTPMEKAKPIDPALVLPH